MIPEIIRVLSFLIPVPFMVLFFLKTEKLDFLKNYLVLTLLLPVFGELLFFETGFGYKIELVVAYITFFVLGTNFFERKGWTFLKAMSLSFCLVYFGSVLWELPYHIYTIIIRGGIDGAFPLHLLFIFPMVFVYEKVKTNKVLKEKIKNISIILAFSTVVMIILLVFNFNIWNGANNPTTQQIIIESFWMISRIVTFFGLFAMYSKSTLRKRKVKNV